MRAACSRRISGGGEIFALNRARQPMHGALADLAGLSLRLKLLGDLLQKLRP
jgi:hypothetical protein